MRTSLRSLLAACVVSLITMLLGAPPAAAQFVGPGSKSSALSVSEILKSPVDNQRVVLRGKIVRRLGGDKYVFTDGTAEIIVDIDEDEWPAQPVNDSMTVEITGKVDVEFLRPTEIDVKRLRVAQ